MKYKHTVWTIQDLISLYDKDKLLLNPEYQRNPIWTAKAQQKLIDTIIKNRPIQNFFLRLRNGESYEMVDGQQRARTIFAYYNGVISDINGEKYSGSSTFLSYPLNMTIISRLEKDESIEEFYALVNSSGLRLNRPELKKAEFFNTRFLELITDLASTPEFTNLGLFTKASINRMNDIELVSELVANLKFGLSEKKEKVDVLFENDVSIEESKALRSQFITITEFISEFNKIYPINQTRYKQRNDLYSLFDFLRFLSPNKDMVGTIRYYYRILLTIGPYIRPTQEDCEPLMNYALNCVSQSNSKKARQERQTLFTDLFLNEGDEANQTQKAILDFFGMDHSDIISMSGKKTICLDAFPES